MTHRDLRTLFLRCAGLPYLMRSVFPPQKDSCQIIMANIHIPTDERKSALYILQFSGNGLRFTLNWRPGSTNIYAEFCSHTSYENFRLLSNCGALGIEDSVGQVDVTQWLCEPDDHFEARRSAVLQGEYKSDDVIYSNVATLWQSSMSARPSLGSNPSVESTWQDWWAEVIDYEIGEAAGGTSVDLSRVKEFAILYRRNCKFLDYVVDTKATYCRLELQGEKGGEGQRVIKEHQLMQESKRNIVLLGTVGSGKTTMLKYLLENCTGIVDGEAMLGIFVRLSSLWALRLKRCGSAMEMLKNCVDLMFEEFQAAFDTLPSSEIPRDFYTVCDRIKEAVERRAVRVTLLIDALDEVPSSDRNSPDFVKWLRVLLSPTKDNKSYVIKKVFLTSRPISWVNLITDRTRQYSILRMSPEQEEAYARNLFCSWPGNKDLIPQQVKAVVELRSKTGEGESPIMILLLSIFVMSDKRAMEHAPRYTLYEFVMERLVDRAYSDPHKSQALPLLDSQNLRDLFEGNGELWVENGEGTKGEEGGTASSAHGSGTGKMVKLWLLDMYSILGSVLQHNTSGNSHVTRSIDVALVLERYRYQGFLESDQHGFLSKLCEYAEPGSVPELSILWWLIETMGLIVTKRRGAVASGVDSIIYFSHRSFQEFLCARALFRGWKCSPEERPKHIGYPKMDKVPVCQFQEVLSDENDLAVDSWDEVRRFVSEAAGPVRTTTWCFPPRVVSYEDLRHSLMKEDLGFVKARIVVETLAATYRTASMVRDLDNLDWSLSRVKESVRNVYASFPRSTAGGRNSVLRNMLLFHTNARDALLSMSEPLPGLDPTATNWDSIVQWDVSWVFDFSGWGDRNDAEEQRKDNVCWLWCVGRVLDQVQGSAFIDYLNLIATTTKKDEHVGILLDADCIHGCLLRLLGSLRHEADPHKRGQYTQLLLSTLSIWKLDRWLFYPSDHLIKLVVEVIGMVDLAEDHNTFMTTMSLFPFCMNHFPEFKEESADARLRWLFAYIASNKSCAQISTFLPLSVVCESPMVLFAVLKAALEQHGMVPADEGLQSWLVEMLESTEVTESLDGDLPVALIELATDLAAHISALTENGSFLGGYLGLLHTVISSIEEAKAEELYDAAGGIINLALNSRERHGNSGDLNGRLGIVFERFLESLPLERKFDLLEDKVLPSGVTGGIDLCGELATLLTRDPVSSLSVISLIFRGGSAINDRFCTEGTVEDLVEQCVHVFVDDMQSEWNITLLTSFYAQVTEVAKTFPSSNRIVSCIRSLLCSATKVVAWGLETTVLVDSRQIVRPFVGSLIQMYAVVASDLKVKDWEVPYVPFLPPECTVESASLYVDVINAEFIQDADAAEELCSFACDPKHREPAVSALLELDEPVAFLIEKILDQMYGNPHVAFIAARVLVEGIQGFKGSSSHLVEMIFDTAEIDLSLYQQYKNIGSLTEVVGIIALLSRTFETAVCITRLRELVELSIRLVHVYSEGADVYSATGEWFQISGRDRMDHSDLMEIVDGFSTVLRIDGSDLGICFGAGIALVCHDEKETDRIAVCRQMLRSMDRDSSVRSSNAGRKLQDFCVEGVARCLCMRSSMDSKLRKVFVAILVTPDQSIAVDALADIFQAIWRLHDLGIDVCPSDDQIAVNIQKILAHEPRANLFINYGNLESWITFLCTTPDSPIVAVWTTLVAGCNGALATCVDILTTLSRKKVELPGAFFRGLMELCKGAPEDQYAAAWDVMSYYFAPDDAPLSPPSALSIFMASRLPVGELLTDALRSSEDKMLQLLRYRVSNDPAVLSANGDFVQLVISGMQILKENDDEIQLWRREVAGLGGAIARVNWEKWDSVLQVMSQNESASFVEFVLYSVDEYTSQKICGHIARISKTTSSSQYGAIAFAHILSENAIVKFREDDISRVLKALWLNLDNLGTSAWRDVFDFISTCCDALFKGPFPHAIWHIPREFGKLNANSPSAVVEVRNSGLKKVLIEVVEKHVHSLSTHHSKEVHTSLLDGVTVCLETKVFGVDDICADGQWLHKLFKVAPELAENHLLEGWEKHVCRDPSSYFPALLSDFEQLTAPPKELYSRAIVSRLHSDFFRVFSKTLDLTTYALSTMFRELSRRTGKIISIETCIDNVPMEALSSTDPLVLSRRVQGVRKDPKGHGSELGIHEWKGAGAGDKNPFESALKVFLKLEREVLEVRLSNDRNARNRIEEFKKQFGIGEKDGYATYYYYGLSTNTGHGDFPKRSALEALHDLHDAGRNVLSTFLRIDTDDANMGLKPKAAEWLKAGKQICWAEFVNSARFSFSLLAANLLWEKGVQGASLVPLGPRQNVIALLYGLGDLHIRAYLCAAKTYFQDMDIGGDLEKLRNGPGALASYDPSFVCGVLTTSNMETTLADGMAKLIQILNVGYENQKMESLPSDGGFILDASAWENWETLLQHVMEEIVPQDDGQREDENTFDLDGFFQEHDLYSYENPYLQLGMFFFEAGRKDKHLRSRATGTSLFIGLQQLRSMGRHILNSCIGGTHPVGTLADELPDWITMGKIRKLVEVTAPLDAANYMRYNARHYDEYKLTNYGKVFAVNIDAKDKPNTFLLNSLCETHLDTFNAGGFIQEAINGLQDVYENVFQDHVNRRWFVRVVLIENRLRQLLLKVGHLSIDDVSIPSPLPHPEEPGMGILLTPTVLEVGNWYDEQRIYIKNVQNPKLEVEIEEIDERLSHIWRSGSNATSADVEILDNEHARLLSLLEENSKIMAITHSYCLDGAGEASIPESGFRDAVTEFNRLALKVAGLYTRVCRLFHALRPGYPEWKAAKNYPAFVSSAGFRRPREYLPPDLAGREGQFRASSFRADASSSLKIIRYTAVRCGYGLAYVDPEYLTSYNCMIDFQLFLARWSHCDDLSTTLVADLDETFDVPDRNFLFSPQYGAEVGVNWSARGWKCRTLKEIVQWLLAYQLLPPILENALKNTSASSDLGKMFTEATGSNDGCAGILAKLIQYGQEHAMAAAEVTFIMKKGNDVVDLTTFSEVPKFDIVQADVDEYTLEVTISERQRAQLKLVDDKGDKMVGVQVAEIESEDIQSETSSVVDVQDPKILNPPLVRNAPLDVCFRLPLGDLLPEGSSFRGVTKDRHRVSLYLRVATSYDDWYTVESIPLRIVKAISISSKAQIIKHKARRFFKKHPKTKKGLSVLRSLVLMAVNGFVGAPGSKAAEKVLNL